MRRILFALMLLAFVNVYSQTRETNELYWVVETNAHYRDCSIVRIYDQRNIEVHRVKIYGVLLDVRRPKHRRIIEQLFRSYKENLQTRFTKGKSETLVLTRSRGGEF